jgi:class 3 adenylate cyclase
MQTGVELPGKEEVWLEANDGRRWSVTASCGIGRSATNQVVLESTKISRRHALVHSQSKNEFWLVDLASSNGTYLNDRRVVEPTLLRDGDKLGVGEYQLRFRQPQTSGGARASVAAPFKEVKLMDCWLLLAEVLDATMMVQKVSTESLPQVMERWLAGGREIVQRHGGTLNKYLGDGFLAYWQHQEQTTAAIAQTVKELLSLQQKAEPPFRFVVHYGSVAFGLAASSGEETLMGQEVNRLFRMEKLAGSQGQSSLVSAFARNLLKPKIETFELGSFVLLGFRQPEIFYSF